MATGIGWIEATLHTFNASLAAWPIIVWVAVLLIYSYVASVLPVWVLLQPRDYINSLQLISALGLIVVGLAVAAVAGGALIYAYWYFSLAMPWPAPGPGETAPSYEIQVDGQTFTVQDLIEFEKATCVPKSEL
ncbi:carbon starvation CstA family protein, partial [Bremerella sp. JC817]